MASHKPWRAARWTPNPGGRPTNVARGKFETSHDARMWIRRARMAGKTPGQTICVWYETALPPAELAAADRPRLRIVS